ncbi:MAG: WbqC family protein [Desulfobacterales bacterium]
MIVSTSRPYFAPFPGLLSRVYHSDIFVILDNVQFPRGTTWITRNRFKNDQGTLWMTVPVWKKGLGLQKINDVRICQDSHLQAKHLKSLKQAYANAPYFAEHLPFLEYIFSTGVERLIDFNMAILRHLMLYLGADTEVRLLSELNMSTKGEALLIEICRFFEASSYLAPGAAGNYLDPRVFEKGGIELVLHKPKPFVYPQLWGDFLPDLSAFDLVFNCGPKARALGGKVKIAEN